MKKKLYSLFFASLLLLGCGEVGIEFDVTKTSTVAYIVSASAVNAQPGNALSLSQAVNFASDDFDEYIEDAEAVKIDKLTFEFKGYDNTSGDVVLKNFSLVADDQSILSLTGLVVENTGVVLAYEDGNPASALSAAQVAAIEALGNKTLGRQAITFKVDVDFTDNIDSDYTIELNFDVTLRVKGD